MLTLSANRQTGMPESFPNSNAHRRTEGRIPLVPVDRKSPAHQWEPPVEFPKAHQREIPRPTRKIQGLGRFQPGDPTGEPSGAFALRVPHPL